MSVLQYNHTVAKINTKQYSDIVCLSIRVPKSALQCQHAAASIYRMIKVKFLVVQRKLYKPVPQKTGQPL